MGSDFFISKKLRRELDKDLKKRTSIEDSIARFQSKLEKHNEKTKSDLDKFYDEIDDSTVLSTFNYIEEYGTKKQKEILVEIEDRYKKTSLLIEDTINLIDWYEKMCDFYKNNDLED